MILSCQPAQWPLGQGNHGPSCHIHYGSTHKSIFASSVWPKLRLNVQVELNTQGLQLFRFVEGKSLTPISGRKSCNPHLHDLFIKSIRSSPKPETSGPAFFAAKRASKLPRFRAFARFFLSDFASGTEKPGVGLVRGRDVAIGLEFEDFGLCLVA